MRKNERFCLHDACGKILIVEDLWARRCPPWPNRSAEAERHSIFTMIQTFAEVLASFSTQFFLCLTGQAMGQGSASKRGTQLFFVYSSNSIEAKTANFLFLNEPNLSRHLSGTDSRGPPPVPWRFALLHFHLSKAVNPLAGVRRRVQQNRGLMVVSPAQRLRSELCVHASSFSFAFCIC